MSSLSLSLSFFHTPSKDLCSLLKSINNSIRSERRDRVYCQRARSAKQKKKKKKILLSSLNRSHAKIALTLNERVRNENEEQDSIISRRTQRRTHTHMNECILVLSPTSLDGWMYTGWSRRRRSTRSLQLDMSKSVVCLVCSYCCWSENIRAEISCAILHEIDHVCLSALLSRNPRESIGVWTITITLSIRFFSNCSCC